LGNFYEYLIAQTIVQRAHKQFKQPSYFAVFHINQSQQQGRKGKRPKYTIDFVSLATAAPRGIRLLEKQKRLVEPTNIDVARLIVKKIN